MIPPPNDSFTVLTREPLDAARLENLVADPGAGAIVSFVGTARDRHLGRVVVKLEYDAHASLALKTLERLRTDAIQRFGLVRAAIHHRLGPVAIGEISVAIAVSAAHRGAAFEGCRHLIDTLKTTVPIWKKEYYADGAVPEWVGPDGKPVSIS